MLDRTDHFRIAVHSDRLALALVSVFWRAAVSIHPAYEQQRIPEYMTNDMRHWLSIGHMPNNWHRLVEIRLQRLIFPPGQDLRVLVPPFVRHAQESSGQFEFVYICGGYCWIFAVPPKQDHVFSKTRAIRPGAMTVQISKVPFPEIPELHDLFTEMMRTPMPQAVESKLPKPRKT